MDCECPTLQATVGLGRDAVTVQDTALDTYCTDDSDGCTESLLDLVGLRLEVSRVYQCGNEGGAWALNLRETIRRVCAQLPSKCEHGRRTPAQCHECCMVQAIGLEMVE